jgi:hypothetical protein
MEIKTPQVRKDCEAQDNEKRPAEPPRAVSRTSKEKRLKKSTFLGYLLYLQKVRRLGEGQERYLLRLQSTVQEEELLAAIQLMRGLVLSQRSAARAEQDLRAVLQRCPILPAKSVLPEQRRIGVGYRDKGSLRPTHRPAPQPDRMWWSEDLQPALLEENIPEEPRWITAEELFGAEGYDPIQELALLAVLSQTFARQHFTR